MSEMQIKAEMEILDEDLKASKISKEDYEKKKAELQNKLGQLQRP